MPTVPLDTNAVSDEHLNSHQVGIVSLPNLSLWVFHHVDLTLTQTLNADILTKHRPNFFTQGVLHIWLFMKNKTINFHSVGQSYTALEIYKLW